ncbi:MAG TPA: M56 family metallopeptidase, partial [Planctomycetaceae bacterium]|nr:M56 family metallopeptidase [Planctomycetaceae bacterium]
MNDAQFLSVAWNQLIQVSLLTVGVWLLTKLFARNRPHLAHAMWLVVLAKCVTPPLLESPTGLFGHLSVPQPVWFEPEIVVEEAIEPVIPEPRVVASNPEFESEITVDSLSQGYVLEDDSLLGQLMFEDAAFELDDELVESVAAISKPPVAEPSVTFLPLWKLWLISAGTVMSLIFLRVMCTLWRVKRQRIETPPELLELVQKLSQQFGLRRRVRVLITSSRVGPAVVGSFRPLLILPDVVTNGRSAKELEPILAHELLHVRRGDLGIGWLQVLVQSLWWFHPLVWLVNRLLNRETERCCDEAVLAELNCSPALYARCLLNVLEQKRNLTPIPAFPGVKPVELTKQRMERIMKLGQGCRKKSPWWCWLVVLLLGAVVLPGTARSQTDAVAPEKSARTTEPDSVAVEATESNTNVQEPRTARVYEVGDLLETLRDEYEFTATEAERALEHSLFNALATLEVARKLRQSSSADRLTSQNVCSGSALFAVSNKEGHRQIERLLELWKEHGFYEVTIEGCMATVPVGFLATNLPSNQRVPLEQAESGKITTPAIPSLTMSNHEFKELQELIQSDTRSNLIAFPRITIPHGTRASVMDIVQHPYIVGYKGDEPIIEVLNKGLELQLNPLVREGTVTQLDCDVKYSRLLKAERRQSRENLFEKQIEPPSPLLNVAGMNVSVLLEPGKTTLLRGLKNKSGEVEEELLVFLSATPRKLNREFLQPVADAREQPTGKLMSGTGVNSDAGVTGSLVLDERNFDLKSPLIYESGKVVEDQKLSLGLPKLNEEHENSYREQLEKLSTQLDQPWEAEYFERPLSEVLLEFHQKLGVRFVIDRDRIAAAGLSEESPVNLSLSGVSLRSIMKMVMAVKLAYCTIPVIDRESGSVTPTLLISNRKEIIRLALLMKSQSIPNFNSIEDLQVKAPGEKHRFIEKQLDQPIAVKFEQTKFTNAFKLIANRLRFTIYIDISSLPEGMTTDALIKDYESANETTLREVLDEICTPHGLIYLIEDEVLKIVGKEWYEQQPVTMVYPWTPRTLNWEDGAWKLDFSSDPTDSPERRGVQEATRKSAAHKTDDQNARLIAKIYPVADLVIPIPGAESDPVKDDP